MPWMQVVGSLWQPEIMHEAPVALRALVEGPTGRDTATQLLYSPQSRAAFALCRSSIPPERAAAWVEGLLSHVEAKHIVFVASLPVSAFSRPVHPLICALAHDLSSWVIPYHYFLSTSANRESCHTTYMMSRIRMQRVIPSPSCKMCFWLVAHEIEPEHMQTCWTQAQTCSLI